MLIEDNVAMVTGGASGLGEATCDALAARGARVAVVDIDGDRADTVARRTGGLAARCDVADEDQVEDTVKRVVDELGAPRILVNCAGISESSLVVNRKGVPNPLANFHRMMAVHVQGTYDTIRLVAATMLGQALLEDGERGVVINTSSVAAFDGQIGAATYSSAKAAIVGMTMPMAREFAEYGIRVNTIAPGLFMTGMADQIRADVLDRLLANAPFPKRWGRPSEFARLAIEVCENVMINGAVLRLDGAFRMPYK
ncbi:MAG: SDR family NAD(P)-dependent oxidoreductase [Proteobacteria bacterium]|nr:SDR family NAD(P)-dependent oxidoreductase [Pseudomonadota bacterium]